MIGFTVTIIKLSISMHSSRMPTARLLPVSLSMHWGGVSALGVSAPGGCLLPGGVCSKGGCLLLPEGGGVCRGGGVSVTPPCEQNDR